MAWGIVINNNYMNRPIYPAFPMFGAYNRMFDMIMKYNMFQFFMNNLLRPQTYQQPRYVYVQPSIYTQQRANQVYNNTQNSCQNIYPNVSFKNTVCPDFNLFEGSKLLSDSSLYKYQLPEAVNNLENANALTENREKVRYSTFKNNAKLGKDFLDKVKQVAQNINCDYRDLLAIMNNESGINPQSGLKKDGTVASAVGLIQFMDPAVAELNNNYNLNLTREKIVKMSAIEQLDLIEKLYKVIKKQRNIPDGKIDAATLYAMIFLPARCNKQTLAVKGEINPKTGKLLGYYEQNPMDENGDGKLTKSDLIKRLNKKRVNESAFV